MTLPESVKIDDRQTALGALKAIVAMGYRIEKKTVERRVHHRTCYAVPLSLRERADEQPYRSRGEGIS